MKKQQFFIKMSLLAQIKELCPDINIDSSCYQKLVNYQPPIVHVTPMSELVNRSQIFAMDTQTINSLPSTTVPFDTDKLPELNQALEMKNDRVYIQLKRFNFFHVKTGCRKDSVILWNIFIEPLHRRKGLATKYINEFSNTAIRNGIDYIVGPIISEVLGNLLVDQNYIAIHPMFMSSICS